jgi:hypothetical protein
MPRTTIDLDPHVLHELKRKRRSGQSLGQLASELLATALRQEARDEAPPLRWHSAPMGARLDIGDKEALHRALDEPEPQ